MLGRGGGSCAEMCRRFPAGPPTLTPCLGFGWASLHMGVMPGRDPRPCSLCPSPQATFWHSHFCLKAQTPPEASQRCPGEGAGLGSPGQVARPW